MTPLWCFLSRAPRRPCRTQPLPECWGQPSRESNALPAMGVVRRYPAGCRVSTHNRVARCGVHSSEREPDRLFYCPLPPVYVRLEEHGSGFTLPPVPRPRTLCVAGALFSTTSSGLAALRVLSTGVRIERGIGAAMRVPGRVATLRGTSALLYSKCQCLFTSTAANGATPSR